MTENRLVFASACTGMLLFGISLITLGSVASGLQEKFQLDAISSGALFSILPIGLLAGSLLFGPLSDRYGYKIVLIVSTLLLFTGFQGIAYAPLDLLKVCIFLFGLGGGAINGASNAVVSDISATNKAANLSLLGIFFAVGALGMPFILGILEKVFDFQQVVSSVGYFALVALGLFILTRFPEAKQKQGIPLMKGLALLKDPVLLLVSFFLFCQTSFEGIINNWTTSFLTSSLNIPQNQALYALSLYVVGMAVMRIFLGSVFRDTTPRIILVVSFAFLLVGCITLQSTSSYWLVAASMVCIGAGLAAGFPVMLGFIGQRFAELSGTAFSLVLVIAMTGNMLINYLMGVVAQWYGIHHLTTFILALLSFMILFSLLVLRKLKIQTK